MTFPDTGALAALEEELQRSVPELDARTVRRLARGYGTDIRKFVRPGALGQYFGHGLYEAEVDWLVRNEWARTAEDILWRRTKLGLRLDGNQQSRLAEHMKNRKADWRKAAE